MGNLDSFMIHEENRWNEKPRNLELGKDRIAEKDRGYANACTKNGCIWNPYRSQKEREKAINNMVAECKMLA